MEGDLDPGAHYYVLNRQIHQHRLWEVGTILCEISPDGEFITTMDATDKESILTVSRTFLRGKLNSMEAGLLIAVPLHKVLSVYESRDWLSEGCEIQENDIVFIVNERSLPKNVTGKVRYKGHLPEQKGILFGLELSKPFHGLADCNGSYNGVQFFLTADKSAMFVSLHSVRRCGNRGLYVQGDEVHCDMTRLSIGQRRLQVGDEVVWIDDLGDPVYGRAKSIGRVEDQEVVDVTFDTLQAGGTRAGHCVTGRDGDAPRQKNFIPLSALMRASDFTSQARTEGYCAERARLPASLTEITPVSGRSPQTKPAPTIASSSSSRPVTVHHQSAAANKANTFSKTPQVKKAGVSKTTVPSVSKPSAAVKTNIKVVSHSKNDSGTKSASIKNSIKARTSKVASKLISNNTKEDVRNQNSLENKSLGMKHVSDHGMDRPDGTKDPASRIYKPDYGHSDPEERYIIERGRREREVTDRSLYHGGRQGSIAERAYTDAVVDRMVSSHTTDLTEYHADFVYLPDSIVHDNRPRIEDHVFEGRFQTEPVEWDDSPTSDDKVTPSNELSDGITQISDSPFQPGDMVEVLSPPMYGVLRWIGTLPRYHNTKLMAGIELEQPSSAATDGTFAKTRVFYCEPKKGLFVPLHRLRPDNRLFESLVSLAPFGSTDSPAVTGSVAPRPDILDNIEVMTGKFKGIQGHRNSCYMDASLFAMFSFNTSFDEMLHRPMKEEDCSLYDELRTVLRENIVNPLRQYFYVRADKIMMLREMLDKVGDVEGLLSEERDAEEFMGCLFKVLRFPPLLQFADGREAHLLQLFLGGRGVSSTQRLLDTFCVQSSLRMRRAPATLVLTMPRHGKQKLYEGVVPSLRLDVTDLLAGGARECGLCGEPAGWECAQCVPRVGLHAATRCADCDSAAHRSGDVSGHVPRALPAQPEHGGRLGMRRETLDLYAVVCIATSHYVSFVRCGDDKNSKWVFFDSMADRKGAENGYNIPVVDPCPELGHYLHEMSDSGARYELRDLPKLISRCVADNYMCFYRHADNVMYS